MAASAALGSAVRRVIARLTPPSSCLADVTDVAAIRDKLRATLPSAREVRVLGAGVGSCPPAGVGRVQLLQILVAACVAALLALPGAAGAQAPSNCATGGPTGDPVNDCVKALGGVDLGPAERFLGDWTAPRITALTLPTVPPAVCQMRSEQHITVPAVRALAVFACNNEVPASLSVSIVNDNGLLTSSGTYYYYQASTSCTGERTCQVENLIGGSSGALYRTRGRFTITAPGLSISAQPYCQRRSPSTTECFTSDTMLALAR